MLVDGASVGAVSSYTFISVTADHTIDASFAINTHTLTTSAVDGSITLSPDLVLYDYGTVVSLTAVPDAGYHFTSWSGDLAGSINPESLTMDSDKAVTSGFSIDTYVITATAGANGTITPSGAITVDSGADAGIHQGFLEMDQNGAIHNIPYSYMVSDLKPQA